VLREFHRQITAAARAQFGQKFELIFEAHDELLDETIQ
jgi:hypothetical protein